MEISAQYAANGARRVVPEHRHSPPAPGPGRTKKPPRGGRHEVATPVTPSVALYARSPTQSAAQTDRRENLVARFRAELPNETQLHHEVIHELLRLRLASSAPVSRSRAM